MSDDAKAGIALALCAAAAIALICWSVHVINQQQARSVACVTAGGANVEINGSRVCIKRPELLEVKP